MTDHSTYALGTLPPLQAEIFVERHRHAKLGSLSSSGLRRVVAAVRGPELLGLIDAFAEMDGAVRGMPPQQSIPVLSPGIRDPIPCVPCQQSHTLAWAELPEVVLEYSAILRRMISGNPPLPPAPEPTTDEGVVYVGGGKYWPGIVVGIRLLRESGCRLPVQVWYRGEAEPVDPADLDGISGVTLIDSLQHAADHGGARRLHGWEAKLWALVHCGIRRVLYLDADAYCVADPAELFAGLKSGAAFQFWHDLDRQEANVKWPMVFKPGPTGVPTVQGGQLLVDTVQAWELLCIAHWMNQHSDFYYHHMFGDQDVWRVALAALGGNQVENTLWKCLGPADWSAPAFVLPSLADPVIVHRCQGKLFDWRHIPDWSPIRDAYSSPCYHLPRESRVFSLLAGVLDNSNCHEVFGQIYAKKFWGTGDPSGSGSSVDQNEPWLRQVSGVLRDRALLSVVDLGCGTGHTSVVSDHYTGIDCVADRIEQNREAIPEKTWIHLDFFRDRDDIPAADVLLIKDVLHHWPTWMIRSFLQWIVDHRDRWQEILICGDCLQVEDNADCHLGGYRALSCGMRPFGDFPLEQVATFARKAIVRVQTRQDILTEISAEPVLPTGHTETPS